MEGIGRMAQDNRGKMTASCEVDTVFLCCLRGCKRRCKRVLAVFFCFVFALNVVLFVFF